MIGFLKNPLRRFLEREDGSMVVPVALWTPVFLALIGSSIELGTVTVRHTALERSLDQAVRDLRLGTGGTSNDIIKEKICSSANILPDCMDKLHLEMVRLDLRDWSDPPAKAQCTDTAPEAITPLRNFEHGGAHEMMMIRACFKYQPITPAGMLGGSMKKDAQGYTAIISTTAFVHEPT
ncbi:TadE/TadG family type IV pilus assembly protein [Tropicibacter naphthalenivorans]|uniref:Flp pilus assembly protein TadG n=1 Tax=Tropicibacter naphthalenivorans TaxID=441103 RepID=A0A0N7LZJ9_9RHOB|nr:TadE family protein [Tropicibacter naphthalenivorans]CUH77873.1 hypothetical protein TRN7648_01665 [Tropicibacter naphthalenivorans]SMC95322.1 hypothetical protein SAMN04488093_107176 [Tropicibacter naphthalenivorans]